MNSIVRFRGAEIPKKEAIVLRVIEKQVGDRFKLGRHRHNSLGFSVESIRVVEINMPYAMKFGDLILPKAIKNLTFLRRINLSRNEMTALPEEIGQLRSLQELYLFDNNLTSLPESIGHLFSLQVMH